MSFEGYEMALCATGHLFEDDVYSGGFGVGWTCPLCGAPKAWSHTVDQTNGADDPDAQRPELTAVQEAVFEVCNLKHRHMIRPAVYKIPEKGEEG